MSRDHDVIGRGETLTRRSLVAGSVAGFVLTASGLFLPDDGAGVDARDGALGGELGGRRGQNRRGRDTRQRRDRGDRNDRRENDRPPQGWFFRNVAIYVYNYRAVPIEVEAWQQRFSNVGHVGEDWWYQQSGWGWSAIEGKPENGSTRFKNFVGDEWNVAVRIGTDRVVNAWNDAATPPYVQILSGGWTSKGADRTAVLADGYKIWPFETIQTTGIKVQRIDDNATHIRFNVDVT